MMIGLAEDAESVMFPHTIKMLDWGKRFNVHLRRDQLKMPDVSGDPGTWKMIEQGIYVMTVVVSLVVQKGAVAWSRSATGAVTIATQHFDSFPLIYIGGCISVMREVNAAAGRLSF